MIREADLVGYYSHSTDSDHVTLSYQMLGAHRHPACFQIDIIIYIITYPRPLRDRYIYAGSNRA